MKKLVVATVILFLSAVPAWASTMDVPLGMGHKARRGLVNLVTGILEVPMQTVKGYQHGVSFIKNGFGSKSLGTIFGLFRGFGHAGGRMGWGMLELVGFWSVNPEDNEGVGIPLDADYAWEEGTRYSLFEPSFSEGVQPIGRKFIRGLANTLFGVLEVPGQAMQGAKDGNILFGVGRGFWYWWSRELYGFGNLAMSLTPNPKGNPGVAFEGEWPWSGITEE